MKRLRCNDAFALAMFAAGSLGAPLLEAKAQSIATDDVQRLLDRIEAIREEQQAEIAKVRERTDEQIAEIEALLSRSAPLPSAHVVAPDPKLRKSESNFTRSLQLAGDFRLRYESNFSTPGAPDRDRVSLRARFGGRYSRTDWLTLGVRLATGDPDDPKSTDVTLSDFGDDLSISLDQVYAKLKLGTVDLSAGKVLNPFASTEMVFDADVNPQGFSGAWNLALPHDWGVRLTAASFVIQEQAASADSGLRGLQLSLGSTSAEWQSQLAIAYYDYDLVGLAGADKGDIRTNLLTADGLDYLSQFHLVDVYADATFGGKEQRWPLRLVGNYVRNRAAATNSDTGYELDVSLGRSASTSDLRVTYGFAAVQTDAVLAAFTQDNTTLGSNYRQHTVSLEYMIRARTVLNLTWYHYRLDEIAHAPGNASDSWLNRVRLSFLLQI